jgi:hypothetical protein
MHGLDDGKDDAGIEWIVERRRRIDHFPFIGQWANHKNRTTSDEKDKRFE